MYKVLVPFTLQREYNKGEVVSENELKGFINLYLDNKSIVKVQENESKEVQKDLTPQTKGGKNNK